MPFQNRRILSTFLAAGLTVPAFLSGCGGNASSAGGGTSTTTPVNTAVASVYVGELMSANQFQILQFPRASQGAATPLASIFLPAGFEISAIDTDSTGQIYVGGSIPTATTQWEVLVY